MKITKPFMLMATVLVCACTSPTPATNNLASMLEKKVASSSIRYQCQSGETVVVHYASASTSKVLYKGDSYTMTIAVSASGSRYVGSKLEWWTKTLSGNTEGTLLHHLGNGRSGDIIERCTAD